MTTAPQRKSKIVIVTHEFSPFRGGVATYTEELAAALSRAGREVEVWAPDYALPRATDECAVPIRWLRGRGSLRFGDVLQFAAQLMARRKRLAESTVVLTSVGAHLAFMILVPLGGAKCGRLVSVIHGSEVLRFQNSGFWKFWARRFFPRVDCILTVSAYTQSLIQRSFLSSLVQRIVIAPVACGSAATRPCHTTAPGDDKIRILTLARVHPRKGQLDTARALARLPEPWRARIVYQIGGMGSSLYLRQVEAVCRAAGVGFKHLCQINPDTLAATYQQSDICAMTSRMLPNSVEGFGISYLEAGFHGKPVVGYRSGGAVEAVVDGETGLLVDEGDVPALANAFLRLLEDPALRQRLGEGGRRYAAKFSWDTTARVLTEALEGLR
ncbi:MAG TPA: glycosyltransferase family 4 protein [Verrucomicrobiae bacterium]|nr:glycosyltransferase family 4 protein [Verrucomicrobiae bacterium]